GAPAGGRQDQSLRSDLAFHVDDANPFCAFADQKVCRRTNRTSRPGNSTASRLSATASRWTSSVRLCPTSAISAPCSPKGRHPMLASPPQYEPVAVAPAGRPLCGPTKGERNPASTAPLVQSSPPPIR